MIPGDECETSHIYGSQTENHITCIAVLLYCEIGYKYLRHYSEVLWCALVICMDEMWTSKLHASVGLNLPRCVCAFECLDYVRAFLRFMLNISEYREPRQ